MSIGMALPLLVALPAVLAGAALLLRSARGVLWLTAGATVMTAVAAGLTAAQVLRHGPVFAAGGWLMLDALSAYHALLTSAVFALSSLYAISYFHREIQSGHFTPRVARRYGSLWLGALAAMMLVLVSNNLGMMWVGIEATTLLTAFLICTHASPAALEAMWKYLLMCSVGVALAFTGILLLAASTAPVALPGSEALLWTNLRDSALWLDPVLLKAGFIFLVIGYGTKAGLAPMHNWLPDAHSQAPAPVSAIFSGTLLNAALYCILRCLPLVEASTGHAGWGRGILAAFGLLSVGLAAVFIVFQQDAKRLLAYSSVENIGVITLGIGLGGFGAVAGLFHALNHSLCKSVLFFCAGSVGQSVGTHDLRRMAGAARVAPLWGGGFVVGLLALIGVAPFALFLSEFYILRAAVEAGSYWTAGLFLAALATVFVAVLRHAIAVAWGPVTATAPAPSGSATVLRGVMVFVPLAALLILGVWMPPTLLTMLTQAAQLIGGGP